MCFKAVAGAGPAAGGTRPCPALDSSPTPQTPTPAPGYDALVRLVRDVLLAAAGPGGQNAPTGRDHFFGYGVELCQIHELPLVFQFGKPVIRAVSARI